MNTLTAMWVEEARIFSKSTQRQRKNNYHRDTYLKAQYFFEQNVGTVELQGIFSKDF